MSIRIAVVGAGSRSFGPATIRDVLLSDALNEVGVELVLMDVAAEHLPAREAYARSVGQRLGRSAGISSTTDLDEALRGADYVVTAIELDRYLYWSQDFHIPRHYGFMQVFGENGGPGGGTDDPRAGQAVRRSSSQPVTVCSLTASSWASTRGSGRGSLRSVNTAWIRLSRPILLLRSVSSGPTPTCPIMVDTPALPAAAGQRPRHTDYFVAAAQEVQLNAKKTHNHPCVRPPTRREELPRPADACRAKPPALPDSRYLVMGAANADPFPAAVARGHWRIQTSISPWPRLAHVQYGTARIPTRSSRPRPAGR